MFLFCLQQLIYDSFAQYLVAEKGYKEDLLSVTFEDWDFCFKGLVLDLEEGNFLKLAADGTILRASHGTKMMTAEMIEEVYGEKREWKHFKAINGTYARSAKYYFYDNYFDLPGALLCAKIVDSLETTDGQKKYDFWKDVISAIEHNYKTTAFKAETPHSHEILWDSAVAVPMLWNFPRRNHIAILSSSIRLDELLPPAPCSPNVLPIGVKNWVIYYLVLVARVQLRLCHVSVAERGQGSDLSTDRDIH
ncbi:unnamed protein product [Ranitomeya imitator]|uniref:Uncharacterized protein n=1 Tax=Ranitomeya imitator TaxID=111125 RepID=A0ABN9LQY7_9NEOB|nr:unnamed protein product [Ranitomeya imitator]